MGRPGPPRCECGVKDRTFLLKFSPKWTEYGQRRSLELRRQWGNEWMAKYKNSVADIELPNIKTWHSVSTLKDDQEALIDTQLSMASGSKTDVKSKSRPSSLKISDSNIETDETEEENRSFGCQDIKQFCPICIILLITVVIMVTVIPYAFSNVIKQMQAADAVAEWREKMEKMNQTTE